MVRNTLFFFLFLTLCCFTASDSVFPFQGPNELWKGPCAIFVAPTTAQLDSLKIKMNEPIFFKLTDESIGAMSKARAFLEIKKINIANVEAIGVLKFKTDAGKIIELKIAHLNWAVIMFNGKSKPIIANMAAIENDYLNYMK
jgi:hypothetical protein